ncbi:MAG: hypothetical protein JO256_06590, partial [Alphaproteobacteria bacterium]|nr:hypothetical protein [Alphaproteobacteria bacterium]
MKSSFAGRLLAGAALCVLWVGAGSAQTGDFSKEWPTYGHDAGGMRFSPLTQVTRANVANLGVAWTYHMRPADYVPPG